MLNYQVVKSLLSLAIKDNKQSVWDSLYGSAQRIYSEDVRYFMQVEKNYINAWILVNKFYSKEK